MRSNLILSYIVFLEAFLLTVLHGARGCNRYSMWLNFVRSPFVNFIATILTSRMAKKADEAGLLDTMSYGELMDDLSSAWRSVKCESVKPKDNDRCWIHTLPSVMEELVKLNLATCTKEKRSPRSKKQE